MKTATAPLPPLRSVKVLDQLRERIRYLHYSLRTEQAYVNSSSVPGDPLESTCRSRPREFELGTIYQGYCLMSGYIFECI